ncbi:Mini-ribonuclease 3 [Thermoflavimicrobium dichotomicum]|uniref:Mini-ribonuclease 3 n=1 Tax=Thermoflavimicrobium dichotomicum TaxID=46223 RepID=A0A1I3QSS7_9BACL|nr:ribonuclease III domain-containing protein [Thermoflavimicrobium dichotomicum]SFJ37333.1 ribonuclease-3 family protein [Thermoflavimicrobium dichotomicum]
MIQPLLFSLPKSPQEMNPLVLAYIGDAVYEVYVRQFLIAQGISHPQNLQKEATKYVSAGAQADIVYRIKNELAPDELAILKRGRNAKSGSIPKNAKVSDYRYSTGLEALIGFLYLSGNYARLQELMQMILQKVDEEV